MAAEIPNLAVLLAPHLDDVPDAARPAFLAGLERSAAERYRRWAAAASEAAPGLLACAKREEEIARQADTLFPVDANERARVEEVLPKAIETYYAVFADLPLREQLRIQAGAERQGADAWRSFAAEQQDASIVQALHSLSSLEEENASNLDQLLADPAAKLDP